MGAVIANQHAAGVWPTIDVPVSSGGDVRRVQGVAASAAVLQGFSTPGAETVARVAAEMAAHLVAHHGAGRMVVRLADDRGERRGVEILLSTTSTATPSEADLHDAALESELFEVYTAPETGTVMVAQLWGGPQSELSDRRFLVGSSSAPIEGETISGDAYAVEQRGARVVALVADGLGHGEEAAAASTAAVSAFRAHFLEPVECIAARVHDALRRTRGAAIALAEIDQDAAQLRFCGIGNITARLLVDGGAHELISRYGIAGYRTKALHTDTRRWPDDAMLVMHSDGLSSRWNAGGYPRLRFQHPQLAASTVMRDAARADDDALVIAVRGTDGAATRSPRSERDR